MATKSTKKKSASSRKAPTRKRATAKKRTTAKTAPKPDADPHPLAEIKLDESDYLWAKFHVAQVKGTAAEKREAQKDFELWQQQVVAAKASKRNVIRMKEAAATMAENDQKAWLSQLEHKLGVNLSNYIWTDDGRLLYEGDPEKIEEQKPTTASVKQHKESNKPPPGQSSDDSAEAEFLNQRVVW